MNLADIIAADSYLEEAFLRWVLDPAAHPGIVAYVEPQAPVPVGAHVYKVDYVIRGASTLIAVELDGYAWHSGRDAFTYDRLRQNDLAAAGYRILRFSYAAIRDDTVRCVEQLRAFFADDAALAPLLRPVGTPVPTPVMPSDPLRALLPMPDPLSTPAGTYFDQVRHRVDMRPLRDCQREAIAAMAKYYGHGGARAATVMSVGAGKTALGVLACLSFARRRALIVTPGGVIRGTFSRALDPAAVGNVLYGLPSGPMLPGSRPPGVLTLDADEETVSRVSRDRLLAADVIVTNFHSLGDGSQPEHLLAKLAPGDVDFIVVDEAHIAAADSYQRLFAHFAGARTLLMSACFQRLDGKPIDADVVYRYRLIDSILDGHAKNLRLHPFRPNAELTTYEIVDADGRREEIVGRDALLEVLSDPRKLATITAKSHASIRQVLRTVKACLSAQTDLLHPVKPRALFSALGEQHARQIAMLAEDEGIPCGVLHHSMSESERTSVRARFESDSGDLQAIVQLRMLGQGYDFPPITVVAPMRPYGSFGEFYQFVGRGIRVIQHPALTGRVTPEQQFVDVVYHSELGLEEHIDAIRVENDMDPAVHEEEGEDAGGDSPPDVSDLGSRAGEQGPETFVLFESGAVITRVVHDADRIEARRTERERETWAAQYAAYAQTNPAPVPFEAFITIMQSVTRA